MKEYPRNRSNRPPPFWSPKKLIRPPWPPKYRRTSSSTRTMERITNIQSFGSGNLHCGNVTNSHNNITVNNTDDEDNQIRQWLSPLRPQHRHRSLQSSRVNGVGGWFPKTDDFREWSSGQGAARRAVLFCYGHPGVGKTRVRSVRKLPRASEYH